MNVETKVIVLVLVLFLGWEVCLYNFVTMSHVTRSDETVGPPNIEQTFRHSTQDLNRDRFREVLSNLENVQNSSSIVTSPTKTTREDDEDHDDPPVVPKNSFLYPSVTASNPCTLTAVVMDPRLPKLNKAHSIWAAMESLIVHGPDGMCLLLQTSSCPLHNNLRGGGGREEGRNDHDHDLSDEARAVLEQIVSLVPPPHRVLHSFLHKSGRTRVSLIDHTKYKLKSCTNFFSPSMAWMNRNYWNDEFIDDTNVGDNDMILMFQSDAVLCNDLNIDQWRDLAYVGAPWRNNYVQEGFCNQMQDNWKKWNTDATATEVPKMCTDGYGPQGNGGLSLRSRQWMRIAIESCPSQYSGLDPDTIQSSSCHLDETESKKIPEDLYFSTVLRGIHAPMPLAFEASLFSSEMLFPDMVANQWYGPQDVHAQKELVMKRLGEEGLQRYNVHLHLETNNESLHFVPIGIHKFWFHNDMNWVVANSLHEQCPYLKDIVPMKNIPFQYRAAAQNLGFRGVH